MEHRWSIRLPVMGSIIVNSPPVGTITANLRDISLGGVFVDPGRKPLPVNAPVILSFSLNRRDRIDYFRLHAMVVRATEAGAGLMFLDHDPESVRPLRDMLYEELPAPPLRSEVPFKGREPREDRATNKEKYGYERFSASQS